MLRLLFCTFRILQCHSQSGTSLNTEGGKTVINQKGTLKKKDMTDFFLEQRQLGLPVDSWDSKRAQYFKIQNENRDKGTNSTGLRVLRNST